MRAMILAAGRGTRMRPLTDTTPKPLLDAGGKPLIVWHIERLVAAGITRIIINHAWLGAQIEDALGDGRRFGAQLHYSPESPALETAGGIARALWFFQNNPFLVINGDIWCDWTPDRVHSRIQTLAQGDALAWLLLVNNPAHNPEGDFVLTMPQNYDNGSETAPGQTQVYTASSLVQRRTDGPCAHQNGRPLTFAGIGLYHPRLFTTIPRDQPAALAPLLHSAIAQNQVVGTLHKGMWIDVGTPERLNLLKQHLAMKGQARYTLG